ncbi:DUF5313 family protein [Sanguibacter sp. 25GB23B1]|uniref:DUF5313 family protein n=1 Tax=unclassified Sanguibacter TaxID=2645534 RepID=UPI0032AF6595
MARRSDRRGVMGELGAADPLERSARFWLRAYPRRWRAAFGDDLVGVLSEISAAGTVRVPAREAAAIVQGGWALRLREHPPLLRWLGYRFFERRLPERYQHWVADDILGRFWFTRYMSAVNAMSMVGVLGYFWLFSSVDPAVAVDTVAMMYPSMIGMSVLLGGALSIPRRRKAWQRHIAPEVPWMLLSERDRYRTVREARGA